MIILLYVIGIVVFASMYVAYVHTHKDDRSLMDSRGDWTPNAETTLVAGAVLWIIAIPGYILYRIAYKFFEKSKQFKKQNDI